jgi:hypothetical protein
MATNRDLLKEAIADAKAVKEMAIANAKAALEEAFTPQLKTMLSAKLQEMEKEELEEDELDEAGFEKMDSEEKGFDGQFGNIIDEEKDDEIAEFDLEELLAELEEEEKMEEAELNESEITEEEMEDESRAERADVDKYEYEKGKEAGEEEGEALDLEDMTDDDLKKFIEDVIADMVESGELEAGEGAEEEEGEDMDVDVDVDDVDVDVDVEDEEEVDLAELLKEIEDMEEGMKYYEDDVDEAKKDEVEEAKEELDESEMSEDEIEAGLKDIMDKAKSKKDLRENMFTDIFSTENLEQLKFILQQKSVISKDDMILLAKFIAATTIPGVVIGATAKAVANLAKRIFRKKSPNTTNEAELNEAYDTIKVLKKELNEINLLNAKLLYTNKIFRSKNLTESQKVKVLGSFDNATTVKETKLVYNTLNEGIKVRKPSVEKTLGSASKATNTPTIKKPIVESNDAYLRMQKLAGLI